MVWLLHWLGVKTALWLCKPAVQNKSNFRHLAPLAWRLYGIQEGGGREGFKKILSKNARKKLSLLELNQRYCLAERRTNFYLHMLANIPESRWARSWMSLILSLMSVIPSLIWSDSDFRTGLDWSMIVHSDSWTFFSSESQDPTGPDVGRSFMLKSDKIFDNFQWCWSIYNVWTSNLYLWSRDQPGPVWPTVFRMTNSQTFISNVRLGHLKDVTLTFVGL